MDNYIQDVVTQITTITPVEKIFLFSKKLTLTGETASFKICIIVPNDAPVDLERTIYIDVDSEIPFDVVVYKRSIWDDAVLHSDSFAQKVIRTGSEIYGQTL